MLVAGHNTRKRRIIFNVMDDEDSRTSDSGEDKLSDVDVKMLWVTYLRRERTAAVTTATT